MPSARQQPMDRYTDTTEGYYEVALDAVDAESPSAAVYRVAAALRNCGLDQLDPIVDAVDPDALDRLVTDGSRCTVSFRYEGFAVEVVGDRRLRFVPVDDQAAGTVDE